MTTLLSVDSLAKQYGARWALQSATFDVHAGEILGLIGPNGSGKTTLFACVAGAVPATAGAVRHGGLEIAPGDRKRALFFMPDGIRPWPDQDVAWAIRFVAEMFGTSRAARDDVIRELGLERLLGARMKTLSKGEHKRVLLAIGLVTTQPLLLLDEPFDGLDLLQTRDVMQVLRAHAARGRTLFLSIHQLGDAARVCDRLILLSDGRIVGAGTLEALRNTAHVSEGGLEEVFLALT